MPLRMAIAGLKHGSNYLSHIRKHPDTELAAVVDVDSGLLNARAAEYGVPGFSSIGELLSTNLADAAIVAVPTPFHAELSTACLEAGLHVLQEKPLCRNDAEAAEIGAAVKRSGLVFQVGYEVRSSALVRAVRSHIERGDLGGIVNVWYNMHTLDKHQMIAGHWQNDRSNMGGKLFDCAPHYLDVIGQWAGAPVVRVAAFGNKLSAAGPCGKGLPESAVILLEYANGVRGTFNFSAVTRVNDDASFGVVGTTGRVAGNPWLPEGAGSYELRTEGGLFKGQIVVDGGKTSCGHLGFSEQFDKFVNAVLRGGPNACTFDEASALHRLMVAIDNSLATGQVVEMGG